MSDKDFRNDLNYQEPVKLSPEVARQENFDSSRFTSEAAESQRLAKPSYSVRHLYTWLWALTGIAVLFVGLLAVLAFWLRRENDQLAQQFVVLNTYKAEIERVKTLEPRISGLESQTNLLTRNQVNLNQQMSKRLASQLKVLENRFKVIENNVASLQISQTALQMVESNTMTREQVEQRLQRALKEQKQKGNSSSPSISPSRH